MKAKIQVKNATEIQKVFAKLPDTLKIVALDLIKTEFDIAVSEAKSIANSQQYQGQLSEGIELTLEEGKYVYKSKAPHSAFAEFGTLINYTSRRGFDSYAKQFKKLKIHGEGKPWDRIKEWAQYKKIPKEFWWPIYRKIVIDRQGTRPIANGSGFFIGPYYKARNRVIKGLKKIFPPAFKRSK
jgi:hypothetical protein